MTFEEWAESVPSAIREDTVWRIEAYRLSLFLADLAWIDFDALQRKPKAEEHRSQLLRASSRISANIVEGYSRDNGKARATYYEYAVGSTRETRDWYFKVRSLLKPRVVEHRIDLCTQITKLCIRMCSNERKTNRRASGN